MQEDNVYKRMFEREREARKRAEELLESMSLELYEAYSQLKTSSEEKFAIFRSVTDGIVTFSQSGIIESMNPAVERIFGFTDGQLVGSNIQTLLAKDEQEVELDESFWVDRCSETQPTFATRGINSKGQIFEMELSASRASDRGREFFVWVVRNTQQIRSVERKVALSQRLEAIGQLAAGVSHEINTPIQYVHENTKFLQDAFEAMEYVLSRLELYIPKATADPSDYCWTRFLQMCKEVRLDFFRAEVPRAIEETIHGSNQVTSIVHAIREFAHPGNMEMSPLDLNRAIASAITVSASHWREYCDIVTELDPNLPVITCHAPEINQVILNLLVNACDAIAEAIAWNGSRGRIAFRTSHEGNIAKMSIRDNGSGIKRENLDRIFTPFFTTKSVGKGTGQGLAIVHTIIVERHGGSIDVQSQPGEGTTFVVSLPIS